MFPSHDPVGDEVVDTYYDEFDDEDLDQEPTDEELMNLDIDFGNE